MKRSSTGSTLYTDQQLILAARLYYIDGLSQAEIGTFVRVSQSKVSRMLAIAQERGLVRISVPEFQSRNTSLETTLRTKLGVDATVIHSLPGIEVRPLRQILGYFAAPVVRQWIQSQSLIVLAGGRTVQPLIDQLRPQQLVHGLRVAQGMGHIDATPGPYDAAELCRTLAKSWNGAMLGLNAPLLFPDKEQCHRFMRLRQIQDAMRSIAQADIAIVGVGTLEESVLVERSVFSTSDIAEVRNAGATGEILGRFYDHRGVECRTTLRERTMSLELEKLRKISRRIGVVVGADRAHAMLAAIHGGLLSTVILDEGAATALIELDANKGRNVKSSAARRPRR